ncbi:MAG: molybdenum cofactor biosysynthesis protein [Pedosphaera sp.]|nr:molybdenum cofactor biosysynthesis protein [Pedosphaera sp.]
MVLVLSLSRSSAHNFTGHHGRAAGCQPVDLVSTCECIAGRGIRGDRFFDCPGDVVRQITFFASGVLAGMQADGRWPAVSFGATRRNVLVEAADLGFLIGQEFEIQGIQFRGHEECRPCYWMDQAIGPGAEKWLRGRGGLRAQILNSSWLTVNRP